MHQLLSACVSQLDLQTIGRMCTCSKAMRALLHGALPAEAPRLLLAAAQQAAEACNETLMPFDLNFFGKLRRLEEKTSAAQQWLLQQAPSAAAALDVPALLRIPNMHHVMAWLLVEAGVRVSYAQLVAAARDRVAGVQVWVTALAASPALLADSGVPELLLDLICDCWVNQDQLDAFNPSPDDPGLADLLHFLGNSLDGDGGDYSSTTQLALHFLSDQLLASQPQLVLELLATAVQRNSQTVVDRLLQAPAARAMEPVAMAKLLQAAMEQHIVLDVLLESPAASQLDADAHIAPLLPLAGFYPRQRLFELPATQRMSADAIASVLEADIRAGHLHQPDFTRLTELPGAAAISSDTLVRLMVAAVRVAQPISDLCRLPSFRQLSTDNILQVFQAAVNTEQRRSDEQSLQTLSRLPAAAAIPPAALEQLVQTATERGKCGTANALCGIQPAANQISAPVVARIVQAAIAAKHHDLVAQAGELSGAAGMSSDAAAQLLHAAASQGFACGVHKCCQLPAARSVPADAVQQALAAALAASVADEARRSLSAIECLAPLLKLPGAAGIGAAGIVELAQAVIAASTSQQHAAQCLQLLCSLPAAAAVTAAQVQQLLLAAMQQGQCSCMALLLGLPGAAALSQEACMELLQHAVDTGYSEYVDELHRLPQAVQQQALVPLLRAAGEQADSMKMLQALLRVPGADTAAAAAAIIADAALQARAMDSNKPADKNAQLVRQQLPAAASSKPLRVLQLLLAAFTRYQQCKEVCLRVCSWFASFLQQPAARMGAWFR